MPTTPAFTIDPTGFIKAGSVHKGSTAPFDDVWKQAAPGDQIVVKPGTYKRLQLQKSPRLPGTAPVAFIGGPGVVIDRDVAVGSTDTLLLKSGQGDAYFEGFEFIADDRAGLKTEGPAGSKAVSFKNCSVHGLGDAYTVGWKDNSHWGGHHYFTAKWTEIGVAYSSIFDEHARYLHNIQGNHTFSGGSVRHCGRTALQVVNRMAESGTPMPEGKGNITVTDETITDVCLEQGGGGSALTFRGGMKNGIVTIERVVVRLGCDARLADPFNKNITGAVVVDSGPESKPGAGDAAWPGGTKEFHLKSCDFEVGTVFPGVSGKRTNVKVSDVGLFTMTDCRIVQAPGAHQIALEILPSCLKFVASGTNEIVGQVKFGTNNLYPTWAAFVAAHPECIA